MKCRQGHRLTFLEPDQVWAHPEPTAWCSAPQVGDDPVKPANPPTAPSPLGTLDVEAIESQRAHERDLAQMAGQVDLSQAVIVGPDDYLLLGFRNASPATLDSIRRHLEAHHPGISERILIANGPDTVAVIQTNGEKA